MKKYIILLLILVIAALLLSALPSCNGKGKPEIAIISDIHVMAESQIGDATSASFLDKNNQSQKMLYISNAIFRTALDKIIESKAKAVLIAGDLTEDGSRASHEAVASGLKKLEDKGIQVFVINGNHDIRNNSKNYTGAQAEPIPNVTPQEFKEIYADFGYAEALETHEGTLSYTANIGKKYRLIAIDASHYTPEQNGSVVNRNAPALTDGLIEWAAEQVARAKEDKRTPIGLMHFPLLPHFGEFLDKIGIAENSKVNKSEELAEALAAAGLNYIFTGHSHTQDISVYNSESGIIYDVMTGCLSNYPSPIRYFASDKKSVTMTTTLLDGLNPDYIPSYVNSDEANELINNYQAFASDFVDKDMIGKILSKLSAETYASILSSIGLDNAESMGNTLKEVLNVVIKNFLEMKIYGKGNSVERIAAKYGVTLPESSYQNVMAVAMSFVKMNYAGDENITPDMAEVKLLKYCIYAAIDTLGGIYNVVKNIVSILPTIDLTIVAESLFKTGEIDLVALNIGEFLSPILSDLLGIPISSNIKAMLGTLSLMSFEDMLMGIPLQNYLDRNKGSVRFEALFDYILFDFAKDNLTVDAAPADNNICIDLKTMEATKL
jgi:3',5'-cyclic AMP phosphodiesterase CpdA